MEREVAMASKVLFGNRKDGHGCTEGIMSTAGTPAGQVSVHNGT